MIVLAERRGENSQRDKRFQSEERGITKKVCFNSPRFRGARFPRLMGYLLPLLKSDQVSTWRLIGPGFV